ncbi:MAG: hypothetical protein ACK53L_24005, partial [Pirellulaceae bacterium]
MNRLGEGNRKWAAWIRIQMILRTEAVADGAIECAYAYRGSDYDYRKKPRTKHGTVVLGPAIFDLHEAFASDLVHTIVPRRGGRNHLASRG